MALPTFGIVPRTLLAICDWKALCPYFGYQSEHVIKAPYPVTSLYVVTIPSEEYIKKHFKSAPHS